MTISVISTNTSKTPAAPIDVAAFEAVFNTLNSREIETAEICFYDTHPTAGAKVQAEANHLDAIKARDAFVTKLAELSSADPEVTRFKAKVNAAMWYENHRESLTTWIEAAFEPHEENVDLSDAMLRSIARDVFDQATGPLLVAHRHSYYSYEDEKTELEAIRRRAVARLWLAHDQPATPTEA